MAEVLALDGPGCRIELTEERGMTVKQLRGVWRHVELNADGWTDSWKGTDRRPNPDFGKALRAEEVNLYQVTEHLIRPATEARRCSFVEVVARGRQPPRWFVSHWWGEPVKDFVACVQAHASLRHLADETPYWVCAYANNQWQLALEVTENPAETSFRKAMRNADGTLSIIDVGAVTFSRIWCGFEVATTLQSDARKLYDMASTAPDTREPVVITDGLSPEDVSKGEQYGKDWQGGAQGYKLRREQCFPPHVVEMAMRVRIQDGVASVEADRIHILNSIVGALDLDGSPPSDHQAYRRVNSVLHGRFAAALYRLGLESSAVNTADLQLALRNYPCRELTLCFHECMSFGNRALAAFVEFLPTGLHSLRLDCTGCTRLTCPLLALRALSRLACLTKLALDFSRCLEIFDLSMLEGLGGIHTLTELTAEFGMCTSLACCSGLKGLTGGKAERTTGLKSVTLNLSACPCLDEAGLLQGLCALPAITSLSLDLSGSNVALSTVAVHLPATLVSLSISCVRCVNVSDLSILGCCRELPRLTALALDFAMCEKLADSSGLRVVAAAPFLASVSIDLSGCTRISKKCWKVDSVENLKALYPGSSGSASRPNSRASGCAAVRKDISLPALGPPRQSARAGRIFIGNTARMCEDLDSKGRVRWAWTFYVRGDVQHVKAVTLHLHETFKDPVRQLRGPGFEAHFRGWGTFSIQVVVAWKSGGELRTVWELQFEADASQQFDVPVAQAPKAHVRASSVPRGSTVHRGPDVPRVRR